MNMLKQISATCIDTKKYKIYDSFLTYTAIAKTFSHFDLYLIFQNFFYVLCFIQIILPPRPNMDS